MRYRLGRLARVLGAAVITVAVAAAAGAIAIYLTGPSGLISCVPEAPPATQSPIPRWVLAAGAPALVAALIGAFFALAPERVLARLVALVLTAALAAGTFYAVYTYLPAACRP
jgi:membrane associated rhomboid family serine protease